MMHVSDADVQWLVPSGESSGAGNMGKLIPYLTCSFSICVASFAVFVI